MKVKFYPDEDAVYIDFTNGSDEQQEDKHARNVGGDEFHLIFTTEGKLVGMEVLSIESNLPADFLKEGAAANILQSTYEAGSNQGDITFVLDAEPAKLEDDISVVPGTESNMALVFDEEGKLVRIHTFNARRFFPPRLLEEAAA